MIRHLFKMVWNRRRVNGLIIIEIFVSFLVLFVVLTAASYYLGNYRKPLGYNIDRVWSVRVNTRLPFDKGYEKIRTEGLEQVQLAMRDMPEIECVGWINAAPYANTTWTHAARCNGKEVEIEMNQATDGIQKVLSVPVVAGRWFSKEDDASAYKPAVINEAYARLIFGTRDPIGQTPLDSTCRVIGVIKDYRKDGEFSAARNYQFERFKMADTAMFHYGSFLIRVRPGITAAFQGRLIGVLESVRKGWSFDIETLDRARESSFKIYLTPLIVGGIIAGFLLFMVALGLSGVLWQSVSQRTKELGLRRALGGAAENISRQIHGEQFIITTIGVAVGSLLILQLPLLDVIGFLRPETYFTALIISALFMYVITYLCSIIPGWLAMEVQPAEALHYE